MSSDTKYLPAHLIASPSTKSSTSNNISRRLSMASINLFSIDVILIALLGFLGESPHRFAKIVQIIRVTKNMVYYWLQALSVIPHQVANHRIAQQDAVSSEHIP